MIRINKVILLGRLTRDVEVRYTTTDNTLVATFGLAVNRKIIRQSEERKADFFNVIAWAKIGEFCKNYFKKGQQVAIIGRLRTRRYEDKDGKTVFITEVIAEECYFADSKKDDNSAFENIETQSAVTDDDLPF